MGAHALIFLSLLDPTLSQLYPPALRPLQATSPTDNAGENGHFVNLWQVDSTYVVTVYSRVVQKHTVRYASL